MRYVIFASLIFVSNSVLAQSIFEKLDKYYVGGGLSIIDTNLTAPNGNDLNYSSVEVLGGYKHSGFLGAELRIGSGLTKETAGVDQEASISHYISAYWRTETANEVAKIYGLLGYTSLGMDVGEESETQSGLSYGGGIGFVFERDWNLNFEYKWLLDTDDREFTALSANVDYRF